MLNLSNPNRFVSRVFTDYSGRQFRMTCVVAVVNGELKGRLVSVQPLAKAYALKGLVSENGGRTSVECLPIYCPEKKSETIYTPAYAPIVSPYTELYFFTSQPTRAPSFQGPTLVKQFIKKVK